MWNAYYAERLAARKRSVITRSTYKLSPFVVVPPEEYTRKLRSNRSPFNNAPPSPSWDELARSSDEASLKSPTVTSPTRSLLISREIQDSIPSFSVRLPSFREGSSLESTGNILEKSYSKRRLADSPNDHDKSKRFRDEDSYLSQSQVLTSRVYSVHNQTIEQENESIRVQESSNPPEFIGVSEVEMRELAQMSIKDMFGNTSVQEQNKSYDQGTEIQNEDIINITSEHIKPSKSQLLHGSLPEQLPQLQPQLNLESQSQSQTQIESELNREKEHNEVTPHEQQSTEIQEDFEQDMWSIPQLDYGSPEPMNIETDQLEGANIELTNEARPEEEPVVIDHTSPEGEKSNINNETQHPQAGEPEVDIDLDIDFQTDGIPEQPLPDQSEVREQVTTEVPQKRGRGRPPLVPMDDILGNELASSGSIGAPPELDLDTFIKKHTDLLEAAAEERENKEQAVDEIRHISGPVFDEVSMFFKNITNTQRRDLVSRFGSIIVDELEALTTLYTEYLKAEWMLRREKYLLRRLRTKLLDIRMKQSGCKNEQAVLKRHLEENDSKRVTLSGLGHFFDHIKSIRAQVVESDEPIEEQHWSA
ncbi:hypothetical protein F4703DRAFT_1829478 [Phycomyces blakesleeanus]